MSLPYCEVIKVVDISAWSKQFLDSLNQVFGDRIWFAGLQGSFSRGEAADSSDIDTVVILDELFPSDVSKYLLSWSRNWIINP